MELMWKLFQYDAASLLHYLNHTVNMSQQLQTGASLAVWKIGCEHIIGKYTI